MRLVDGGGVKSSAGLERFYAGCQKTFTMAYMRIHSLEKWVNCEFHQHRDWILPVDLTAARLE